MRAIDDRGGFALALVVLLLFTVGVLGATGYQIAVLSTTMARQGSEGQRALAIAQAGLVRYIAGQIGQPPDTATYSIDNGDAIVTSRRIAGVSNEESMYLVKSEGVYLDPSSVGSPARRSVFQYAVRRDIPLQRLGALTMVSGSVSVPSDGRIDGRDYSSAFDCPQTQADIPGVTFGSGTVSYNGSDVNGSIDTLRLGSQTAVTDSLDLAWDVFTDPDFQVDYENSWPSGLPADSFPVVRFTGDVTATWSNSGRGVLIVQGTLTPRFFFTWNGIVLAEKVQPYTSGSWFNKFHQIRGMVVSGLDGAASTLTINDYTDYLYYRCHVFDAGNSVGYFQPVSEAWWEGID